MHSSHEPDCDSENDVSAMIPVFSVCSFLACLLCTTFTLLLTFERKKRSKKNQVVQTDPMRTTIAVGHPGGSISTAVSDEPLVDLETVGYEARMKKFCDAFETSASVKVRDGGEREPTTFRRSRTMEMKKMKKVRETTTWRKDTLENLRFVVFPFGIVS